MYMTSCSCPGVFFLPLSLFLPLSEHTLFCYARVLAILLGKDAVCLQRTHYVCISIGKKSREQQVAGVLSQP